MATRERLYRQFGPILMEAVCRLIVQEINTLRSAAGLPQRTQEQIIDALQNELDSLPLYTWMNEPTP